VDPSIEDEDDNEWANPEAGDFSTEGLVFIPADANKGKGKEHPALLVAANEVSGTTTIFEVQVRMTNNSQ